MNIRANRHYNDPSLGAAFENLAGMFAPMSGSDVAGYAAADLNRQQAARQAQQLALIDMFANGEGPINDRTGIAAGLYTPNQSWGAVQMGDSTTRRGQDLTHGASIYGHDLGYRASTENNVRDNERALATNAADNRRQLRTSAMDNLLNPLAAGERTRDISVEEWAAMGMPEMPETPEFRNDTPTGGAKLTNIQRRDGSTGYALETPMGLIDPVTGEQLPPETTMFSTAAQGSAADVGIGNAVRNRFDTQGAAIIGALDTIDVLENLISNNPASQGLVGYIRGTAQDVIQTGGELGRHFGGAIAEATDAANAGMVDAGLASEMFDPSIPAIEMLMNVLAWQHAKGMSGDRVSNEQLRMAREAIGSSGTFNNQANSLTRLGQLREMFSRDLNRLGPTLSPEIQAMASPYLQRGEAPAGPAAPPPPQPGDVEDGHRFLGGDPADPNSWEAVQ